MFKLHFFFFFSNETLNVKILSLHFSRISTCRTYSCWLRNRNQSLINQLQVYRKYIEKIEFYRKRSIAWNKRNVIVYFRFTFSYRIIHLLIVSRNIVYMHRGMAVAERGSRFATEWVLWGCSLGYYSAFEAVCKRPLLLLRSLSRISQPESFFFSRFSFPILLPSSLFSPSYVTIFLVSFIVNAKRERARVLI